MSGAIGMSKRELVVILRLSSTNLLAQHGSVVPGETQIRIRRIAPKRFECARPVFVVKQKDVTFRTLHKCEYVDFPSHGSPSPR